MTSPTFPQFKGALKAQQMRFFSASEETRPPGSQPSRGNGSPAAQPDPAELASERARAAVAHAATVPAPGLARCSGAGRARESAGAAGPPRCPHGARRWSVHARHHVPVRTATRPEDKPAPSARGAAPCPGDARLAGPEPVATARAGSGAEPAMQTRRPAPRGAPRPSDPPTPRPPTPAPPAPRPQARPASAPTRLAAGPGATRRPRAVSAHLPRPRPGPAAAGSTADSAVSPAAPLARPPAPLPGFHLLSPPREIGSAVALALRLRGPLPSCRSRSRGLSSPASSRAPLRPSRRAAPLRPRPRAAPASRLRPRPPGARPA